MQREVSKIILDNPTGVFYPGQTISGTFELVVDKELKVSAINLISKGRARVFWTEGGGENTRYYYAGEKYFHNKKCVYGKQQTGQDNVVLQPGKYTYPFSCELPSTIPSSFDIGKGGVTAWVRYSIKAHVDIPWAIDKYTKRMITVLRPLDLNSMPNAKDGATNSTQKTLCCCCCASDPITATISVDRSGYVPGESITFRSEIYNGSGRVMKGSEASLLMGVQCHTSMKSRVFEKEFSKMMHGPIDKGGTEVWMNEKIHIPPVAPSHLEGCKIIDLRYYARVVVDPPWAIDLYCPLEVIIGSVPLASVAQQYGFTLPSAAPQPMLEPPTGAPRNIYSDTAMPTNIPQVTLSESAVGRTKIKEGKEGKGTVDYAPVYTYYNWEKPDTKPNLDSMFTVNEKY